MRTSIPKQASFPEEVFETDLMGDKSVLRPMIFFMGKAYAIWLGMNDSYPAKSFVSTQLRGDSSSRNAGICRCRQVCEDTPERR